ncbi:MAG: hypothetical protein IBJ11_07730 [Phycisphaerales bacterium]|nr:hypothetical protein [Phycisphaerales bacterium]
MEESRTAAGVAAAASTDGPPRSWRVGVFLAALLAVFGAVLGAYGNSFRCVFHLDDSHVIVENPFVRSLGHIPEYFRDPATFSSYRPNIDYRPLTQTTYAVSFWLSERIGSDDHELVRSTGQRGYDPIGWQIIGKAVHAGAALMLFGVGFMLFGSGRVLPISWLTCRQGDVASLLGAVLFAVHPITTAAANYTSSRATGLVTLFTLAATALYLRAMRDGAGRRWLSLSLAAACYGCAMLSKSEGASLLGVLLLAEYLLAPARRGMSWWRRLMPRPGDLKLLPFALLLAGYVWLRIKVMPADHAAGWAATGMNGITYLLTQFRAWWFYVSQWLAPIDLIADRIGFAKAPFVPGIGDGGLGAWLREPSNWPALRASIVSPGVLWPLAGWVLVAGLCLACMRRLPAVVLLVGAFVIHLSPHSSLIPLSEMVNEHRPYLPLSGLAVLTGVAVVGAAAWLLPRRWGAGAAGAALLLGLSLGWLTIDRNRVWQDGEVFWLDVATKDPANARAQMNYGLARMQKADYPEAERRFREALRLWPYYHFGWVNLAIALENTGKTDEARQGYDRAVGTVANDASQSFPYYYRGLFRLRQNDADGAIADLRIAVQRTGKNAARELEALARAYLRAGRVEEARAAIGEGEQIDAPRFRALREQMDSGRR